MFPGAVTALKMPSKKYFARGKLKFQAQIPEKVGGALPFCDRFLGYFQLEIDIIVELQCAVVW